MYDLRQKYTNEHELILFTESKSCQVGRNMIIYNSLKQPYRFTIDLVDS